MKFDTLITNNVISENIANKISMPGLPFHHLEIALRTIVQDSIYGLFMEKKNGHKIENLSNLLYLCFPGNVTLSKLT